MGLITRIINESNESSTGGAKVRRKQIAALRAATPIEDQMFASYGYSPPEPIVEDQEQELTTKDWYKNLITSLQRLRR